MHIKAVPGKGGLTGFSISMVMVVMGQEVKAPWNRIIKKTVRFTTLVLIDISLITDIY